MYAWQFQKMLHVSDTRGYARFVTMQNHYNLVYREEEREMIPLCKAEGIGLIPWSPLARGFLAGNRSRATNDTQSKKDQGETLRSKTDDFAHSLYYRDSDFTVVDRITEIAQKRGVNNAQVALAWMLSKPEVSAPIIGASKMSHLEDALKALEIKLDPDEIKALEEPYEPHPILGHS
jgi:aryl-alcohol dehydrogenase (NADP+)